MAMSATASIEQRIGMSAALGGAAVALAVMVYATQPAHWHEAFLYLSFGGAILNVVGQSRASRSVSNLDLALVAITAFLAVAYNATSLQTELAHAVARMLIVGGTVLGSAWTYQKLRGTPGMSATDVKLVAVLSAALPLGLAVYTIAFACSTAVIVAAAHKLLSNEPAPSTRQIPVTGTLAATFFVFWLAYQIYV